jgi:CHAT domain-containing protein
VTRGQGVLGLARAFALAGAQNLLLSLWRVDDAATSSLVTDFYRRLADASPADALHESQLAALSRQRAAGQWPGMATWAAFVLQGHSPFTRLQP